VELTTRQISLLVASLEGSISRMEPTCPMWDEVTELFGDLVAEWMDRTL
jgi:hypothetical protein